MIKYKEYIKCEKVLYFLSTVPRRYNMNIKDLKKQRNTKKIKEYIKIIGNYENKYMYKIIRKTIEHAINKMNYDLINDTLLYAIENKIIDRRDHLMIKLFLNKILSISANNIQFIFNEKHRNIAKDFQDIIIYVNKKLDVCKVDSRLFDIVETLIYNTTYLVNVSSFTYILKEKDTIRQRYLKKHFESLCKVLEIIAIEENIPKYVINKVRKNIDLLYSEYIPYFIIDNNYFKKIVNNTRMEIIVRALYRSMFYKALNVYSYEEFVKKYDKGFYIHNRIFDMIENGQILLNRIEYKDMLLAVIGYSENVYKYESIIRDMKREIKKMEKEIGHNEKPFDFLYHKKKLDKLKKQRESKNYNSVPSKELMKKIKQSFHKEYIENMKEIKALPQIFELTHYMQTAAKAYSKCTEYYLLKWAIEKIRNIK